MLRHPERLGHLGVRSVLDPVDSAGGFWSACPSSGNLSPATSVHNLYTLRATLAHPVGNLDETVAAITDYLSLFHLMVDEDSRSRTRLTLTVSTSDLWQAILLTMNAFVSTGHTPVALTAEPASDHERGVSK